MPMQCNMSGVKCEMQSAKCEMQNVKCDASLCLSSVIFLSFLPLSIQRLGSPHFHPVFALAWNSFYFFSSVNVLLFSSASSSAPSTVRQLFVG